MQSNISNPLFLPRYANVGFSFPAGPGVTVTPHLVVNRDGSPVADGVLNTLVDGISGTPTEKPDNNEYFTLVTDEIVVVAVEAGESVAYNAPVAAANTGTGRVRTGVPGTDQIIGKALDVSDGSGTTEAPHYVRVYLYL